MELRDLLRPVSAPSSLPTFGEVFEGAPCTRPEFQPYPHNLWDSCHEQERLSDAIQRWRVAARMCREECPVLDRCASEYRAAKEPTGVWAGRVPGTRREQRGGDFG